MDLRNVANAGDWLVIGWFTPDYRPLAENLAGQLRQHGNPYHLFAKDKVGNGWDTRRKPAVVLEAMDAYPGETIVLMDVDCIVRGSVEPITRMDADVGLSLKAWQMRRFLGSSNRSVAVKLAPRVVVFKPTAKARTFVSEWTRLCRQMKRVDDSHAMTWAYLMCPEVSYGKIDPRYRGNELRAPWTDNDVIVHDSAHTRAKGRTLAGMAKHAMQSIERRYFRTGHTKRAGQPPV